MIYYIKNNTANTIYIVGVPVAAGAYYLVPDEIKVKLANTDSIINQISNQELQISQDGVSITLPVSKQMQVVVGVELAEALATTPINSYPFAKKIDSSGKKLFKRAKGVSYSASVGSNTFTYTVDLISCKMTGIELVGAEHGDYVDLKILDTTAGTVSGTANAELNQFGFSVQLAKDHHREDSQYDADLFVGLQIEVTYYSQSAKDIGINYILHELKD